VGDGARLGRRAPLVPPTPERVAGHVAASGRDAGEALGEMPPSGGLLTIEKLAINAVMAGTPAAAMPLLVSAAAAILEEEFHLFGIAASTAPAMPALIVNGPARDALSIPYSYACFGGAAGPAPAIGRTVNLVPRGPTRAVTRPF